MMMKPPTHKSQPPGRDSGQDEISAFYQRHYPQLRTHACGLGCDPHTAEDAVQDVFLRLLQHDRLRLLATLPGHHQQASLRLRLRCQLFNHRRDEQRIKRGGNVRFTPLFPHDGYSLKIEDERAPIPGHEPRLCEQSLRAALLRLQQELSPVVWRRVCPMLEGEEHRPHHGARTAATRVALHRARQRLRELLETDG